MTPNLPSYDALLLPMLRAVRSLGHSARIEEIDETVIAQEGFSPEQVGVLHGDGPRGEIEYRLAWTRTYLKKMGVLDNPQRGVWVATDVGRALTGLDARDGAPPIDLIDGERLCELLKEHQLGVQTTERTIEEVVVDTEFFATLDTSAANADVGGGSSHGGAGRI